MELHDSHKKQRRDIWRARNKCIQRRELTYRNKNTTEAAKKSEAELEEELHAIEDLPWPTHLTDKYFANEKADRALALEKVQRLLPPQKEQLELAHNALAEKKAKLTPEVRQQSVTDAKNEFKKQVSIADFVFPMSLAGILLKRHVQARAALNQLPLGTLKESEIDGGPHLPYLV